MTRLSINDKTRLLVFFNIHFSQSTKCSINESCGDCHWPYLHYINNFIDIIFKNLYLLTSYIHYHSRLTSRPALRGNITLHCEQFLCCCFLCILFMLIQSRQNHQLQDFLLHLSQSFETNIIKRSSLLAIMTVALFFELNTLNMFRSLL